MKEATLFKFHGQQVRVTVRADGEPLWLAVDVTAILGYADQKQALDRLDPDEVVQVEAIDNLGRKQTANAVTESGLYMLTFGSRKEEAKPFRRWVTQEVLPAIRKQGYYVPDSVLAENDELKKQLDHAVAIRGTDLHFVQMHLRLTKKIDHLQGIANASDKHAKVHQQLAGEIRRLQAKGVKGKKLNEALTNLTRWHDKISAAMCKPNPNEILPWIYYDDCKY